MKIIPRLIIFYSFALYIVSELFSGLIIRGGIKTIFLGGLIFAGLNLFVRPILKAISFPLNLLTLGLFSFVINAILLYALTRILPAIQVQTFTIQRIAYKTYIIPQMHITDIFDYLVLSAIISCIVTLMLFISD